MANYFYSICIFLMIFVIWVNSYETQPSGTNSTIIKRNKRYLDFIPLTRMFVRVLI